MNIVKIIKSDNEIKLSLYDDDTLNLLESESFADTSTINFYLQTLPRRHKIKKALLIVHDKNKNSVNMIIAEDENSFFIEEN
ncbi:MAG: hypothetical protein WA421_13690 [Nitrososphaeraceae archaeon]